MHQFRIATRFATGIAAALLLPLAAEAADTACMYRGTDDTARVVSRNGDFHTPYPALTRSPDCTRLQVVSGKVVVYMSDEKNSKIIRPRTIDSADASKSPPGRVTLLDKSGMETFDGLKMAMRELGLVIAGDQRLTQGSSRGAESDALAAEIPTGLISAGQDKVAVTLNAELGAKAELFEVSQGGRVLHRQKGASADLRIPASVLVAGSKLDWRFRHDGQDFSGSLEVVPPQQAADIAVKASGGAADATVAALQSASALLAAGYRWDARVFLRQAQAGAR